MCHHHKRLPTDVQCSVFFVSVCRKQMVKSVQLDTCIHTSRSKSMNTVYNILPLYSVSGVDQHTECGPNTHCHSYLKVTYFCRDVGIGSSC